MCILINLTAIGLVIFINTCTIAKPYTIIIIFKRSGSYICLRAKSLYAAYLCQTTVLAVLDTMLQPYEGKPGTYAVYYNILDGDQHGRPPNCDNFHTSEKSCLYKIAKNNNMVTVGICYTKFSCLFQEVVYHDVVQLLPRLKWKKYGRIRFLYVSYIYTGTNNHSLLLQNPVYFLYNPHCYHDLGICFVFQESKPWDYNMSTSVDIFRGICEALLMSCITYNVCVEVYQCVRYVAINL